MNNIFSFLILVIIILILGISSLLGISNGHSSKSSHLTTSEQISGGQVTPAPADATATYGAEQFFAQLTAIAEQSR